MEFIKSVLIAGVLPLLVAYLTAKLTYKREAKKSILEKRASLYLSIQNKAESLAYKPVQIFDLSYRNSVLKYKPQVELIASPRVKGAYLKFYSFIDNYYKEYHKFCIENDPREDKNNYHTVVLEDGEEIEEVSFWSEDIKYFEKSAKSFKHQHSPKIEELKKYLDELYEAMRKDLGSNK